MSQPDSVDPWSTFLRSAQSGDEEDERDASASHTTTSGLRRRSLDILRALAVSGPTPVEDLRRQFGLSALQIAQEVIHLVERDLVEVQSMNGEDSLRLTESGTRLLA
ncbi:hypothetical protein ACQPZ2_08570 [Nocardia pseudovaccinii]|uniref:hypothetical protein n=1 Tax=Nocardia pseudovaccinii TaxID=189540 RepID=UPI003D935118